MLDLGKTISNDRQSVVIVGISWYADSIDVIVWVRLTSERKGGAAQGE